MLHRPASAHQRIRDQRPVAAPGHRFGAHDGGGPALAASHQVPQGFPEAIRLHVVRIASEAVAPPSQVHGIGPAFPPPAQLPHVPVLQARFLQAFGERLGIELGIPSRSGKPPDIDQGSDPVCLKETDE